MKKEELVKILVDNEIEFEEEDGKIYVEVSPYYEDYINKDVYEYIMELLGMHPELGDWDWEGSAWY